MTIKEEKIFERKMNKYGVRANLKKQRHSRVFQHKRSSRKREKVSTIACCVCLYIVMILAIGYAVINDAYYEGHMHFSTLNFILLSLPMLYFAAKFYFAAKKHEREIRKYTRR